MTRIAGRDTGRPPTGVIPDRRFNRLRRYNLVMGLLHAAQAMTVIALATSFTLPVTAAFMTGPPGSTVATTPETLFDVSIAWGCAVFLLLSAAAHFTITSPPGFSWYRAELLHSRNYTRWIEYSLSSSVMIVLIALITGISDIAALVALFGVNVSMILFGLLQEKYEQPGGGMLPFWLGCIAGATPWIAIGIYLVSPGNAASPPGFVYAIFVSLFVCFNCFALNQWLQYRRIGKWRDYLHGESVYITLSLIAKSLLAWQVFAGTLAS
jgi:Heliorhodopsin